MRIAPPVATLPRVTPGSSKAFIEEVVREFPTFRIVSKSESGLNRVIDWALRAVTLGAQDRYLTEYYTVLGNTLYVPPSWKSLSEADRIILLRHERVHLRQRRRFGFAVMAFVYLIPIFPIGLAYGRARLEWEAYAETIRATAEHYGLTAASGALRERIVGRFIGPDYGWMWPFRRTVERWYDAVLAEITALPAQAVAKDAVT